MKKPKLIYVIDPQCGWCYGNSIQFKKLYEKVGDYVQLEIVTAGMWVDGTASAGGQRMLDYMKEHTPRVQKQTGIKFSKAFFTLVGQKDYVLTSLPASRALVAVKKIDDRKSYQMLKEIYKAQFVKGLRINDPKILYSLAEKCEIDLDIFSYEMKSHENLKQTQAEFKRAKSLANGYPTLIVQSHGASVLLSNGAFRFENVYQKLVKYIQ